ncbi:GNAT family N-acetyltransferase [Gellertiella hungarica]|uniref:GNAT superfamily N-acetyltransferase n=1 Tax=Gellertiella hungarica TaxID=1572859 RepID=A0A7W6J7U8_9HYPH|nr:GNAT family N-acetyltransferase [Gellertiella hungarica]MBB4066420.1 GNAT superfamily N-acetyltransferase [Gellertiella hungarica]
MTVRLLDASAARAAMDDLCEILVDCVEGGASVGFMSPYDHAQARLYWEGVLPGVESGGTLLFAAEDENGRLVGTVQVGVQQFPNQPHRADLKKLLVHSAARGRGIARRLMAAAEEESVRRGRILLVLDTATGSPAEEVYRRLGWTMSGTIPNYALFPDGRFCDSTFYYKRLDQPVSPTKTG